MDKTLTIVSRTMKKKIKDKTNIFECKYCRMQYVDKNWADQCEEWCSDHKSCNLDITLHNIEVNRTGGQ